MAEINTTVRIGQVEMKNKQCSEYRFPCEKNRSIIHTWSHSNINIRPKSQHSSGPKMKEKDASDDFDIEVADW